VRTPCAYAMAYGTKRNFKKITKPLALFSLYSPPPRLYYELPGSVSMSEASDSRSEQTLGHI
jgi:hypothetical protein